MQNNGVEKNSALQPALLMKIQELRSNLSRAECKVVDYITRNPQKVITLSVAGLAEASGVSDATVVRTCRKIGMSGYQDLKVTLAQDIVSPLQSIHEQVCADDDAPSVMAKVLGRGDGGGGDHERAARQRPRARQFPRDRAGPAA